MCILGLTMDLLKDRVRILKCSQRPLDHFIYWSCLLHLSILRHLSFSDELFSGSFRIGFQQEQSSNFIVFHGM